MQGEIRLGELDLVEYMYSVIIFLKTPTCIFFFSFMSRLETFQLKRKFLQQRFHLCKSIHCTKWFFLYLFYINKQNLFNG